MKYEILNDEGGVINVIVADLNFVETHHPGKYRQYVENPEYVAKKLAIKIRAERDQLLVETDWTQMPDVPQVLKDKWASYRQALRDVPQQPGFPETVSWPTKP